MQTKIFESLKEVYKYSKEKMAICDDQMQLIWANGEEFSNKITSDSFSINGDILNLPISETITAEFPIENSWKYYSVQIEPILEDEDDDPIGYLLHFFDCEDVQIISDRSSHLLYKSNFFGNIRTELSSILSVLNILKQNNDFANKPEFEKFDNEVRYHILRTYSHMVNYCELSKYNTAQFYLKYQNIAYIIQMICEETKECFGEDCDLTWELDEIVYMDMNSERLRGALLNLLVNSYIYNSKENKQIKVTLKKTKSSIIIAVRDNGDGMDKNTIEKAMKPFGSFEDYGENESLGIALAVKFSEFFNGRFEIKSKLGEFTETRISIPRNNHEEPDVLKAPPTDFGVNPYGITNSILAKAANPFKTNGNE